MLVSVWALASKRNHIFVEFWILWRNVCLYFLITFLLSYAPFFFSFLHHCLIGVMLATFWLFLVTGWTGGEDSLGHWDANPRGRGDRVDWAVARGHGFEVLILAVSPVPLGDPLPLPANQHVFILCWPPGDGASAEGHSHLSLQKPCRRNCLCLATWCVAQFLVGSPASKITDSFSFLLGEQFHAAKEQTPQPPRPQPTASGTPLLWGGGTGTQPSTLCAGRRAGPPTANRKFPAWVLGKF